MEENNKKDQSSRLKELMILYIKTRGIQRKLLDRMLSRTGVYSSQHWLLMEVYRRPALSQTELAKKLGISTAAVAVSLKKLEKNGYIRKAMDSNDNRYNHIEMTEKGETVVQKSIQIFGQMDTYAFQGFTEEELNQFEHLFLKMNQNLTNAMNVETERDK